MQPNKTEQSLSRDVTGNGPVRMRPRQLDPALIRGRLERAEKERRRKAFLRAAAFHQTWRYYHPFHRAAHG